MLWPKPLARASSYRIFGSFDPGIKFLWIIQKASLRFIMWNIVADSLPLRNQIRRIFSQHFSQYFHVKIIYFSCLDFFYPFSIMVLESNHNVKRIFILWNILAGNHFIFQKGVLTWN